MSADTDPSFSIHPQTKGSYRRRAEDIHRALVQMKVRNLPSDAAFIFNYFSCEKLSKIIIGVSTRQPATKVFKIGYGLNINNIKSSCKNLSLNIREEDIEWIFNSQCNDNRWKHLLLTHNNSPSAPNDAKSARWLRNKIVHDMGPSNARRVQEHANFLNAKMEQFLKLSAPVVHLLASQRIAD